MFSSPRNVREDGTELENSGRTLDIWTAPATEDEALFPMCMYF